MRNAASIIDITKFNNCLSKSNAEPLVLKQLLHSTRNTFDSEFNKGADIKKLLSSKSELVDNLLQYLWTHFSLNKVNKFCLIAVGGYGRQKLYPHSDIDILILSENPITASLENTLCSFFTILWDLGFKVGQSTRTETDCLALSKNDLSIYTSLLEMRFLAGDENYFFAFEKNFRESYLWDNKAFFLEKDAEQKTRQSKYNEKTYLLEPDVKYSRGALRDIHHLEWLCLQHYKTTNLHRLLEENILDDQDYQILMQSHDILARIRYALHKLNQKDDNRLFFDKQLILARNFGYQEPEKHKAIEAFMKVYFIHVKEIRALHEIVVQYFYERDFLNETIPINLNDKYELIGNLISQKKNIQIADFPHLLLQAFLELAKTKDAVGFTAWTLNQLRKHLYLIDDEFRASPIHQKLFIDLFKSNYVFEILQEMNRHKVLEKYLPVFEHVIGQTQHDLFHLYTVDQHTLFVLKEIDTLKHNDGLYKEIYQSLEHPELLYLAALFHDIGKGRNTDHSKFGAAAAINFAKQHQLPTKNVELMAWLVRDHLIMSQTAQKKDIHDPNVVSMFLHHVKTLENLNYLYLLTVADIQATNKNLWNSWKDSLLKQLYFASCNYFKALPKTATLQQQVEKKKQLVLEKFSSFPRRRHEASPGNDGAPGNDNEKIIHLWNQLGKTYFQKENVEHIYWHTSQLLNFDSSNNQTLVTTQNDKQHGATEIFICRTDCDNLFANTVLLMDQLQLNIVNAKIITAANGLCLDTYSVLNRENKMITDPNQLKTIERKISTELSKENAYAKFMQRHIPRQLAHFATKTIIKFHTSKRRNLTALTLKTADRPGLLACVGQAFREEKIRLHDAKIATLNNQAEDVFYISDRQNNPFNNRAQQIKLKNLITHCLSLTLGV